jgi:DNA helicase-2/ATP-dependent DNA helicase PcrA
MQDIALLTDADTNESEEESDRVSLMTIHAAKGLEFPYVYVVGLEENLFPSQMALQSREELEEERRLFYVALTRAEKQVYLSYAESRYKWGNLTFCEPSRFIEEIAEEHVELPATKTRPRDETTIQKTNSFFSKQQSQAPVIPKTAHPKNFVKLGAASRINGSDYNPEHLRDLQVGMEVQHERFGTGKVVNMEGSFPNTKATVIFPGVGQKQLLLKFAKLKIL